MGRAVQLGDGRSVAGWCLVNPKGWCLVTPSTHATLTLSAEGHGCLATHAHTPRTHPTPHSPSVPRAMTWKRTFSPWVKRRSGLLQKVKPAGEERAGRKGRLRSGRDQVAPAGWSGISESESVSWQGMQNIMERHSGGSNTEGLAGCMGWGCGWPAAHR